jgi:hypothetical protein
MTCSKFLPWVIQRIFQVSNASWWWSIGRSSTFACRWCTPTGSRIRSSGRSSALRRRSLTK